MEQLLNKFIINNVKLERLESKLNRFNPLKVLKVDEYEIRHSNILSWLLDPNENHGLGEKFIKKFLGEIILLNENVDLGISILDITLNNFYDFQVLREWNNIDILAISKDNKVVLLIENKVRAKESEGQLRKYRKIVEEKFDQYKIIKVFLTVDGEEPSEDGYAICDYYSILKILNHIMELNHGSLNNKVEDFIVYYIDVLKNIVDEDKEVLSLCKEIYSDNKDILDYIACYKDKINENKNDIQEKIINMYNIYEKSINMVLEHGKINPFLEAIIQFDKENNDIILKKAVNSYCCFINKSMVKIEKLSSIGSPIHIIFQNLSKYNKIKIFIEVQSFGDNYELRQELLHRLNDINEVKISDKSFNPESKYTRVYTKTIILKDVTEHNILDHMRSMYQDSHMILDKIISIASSVLEEK